MLDPTQIEAYQRDGYVVLPGFKPTAQIAAVRERAAAIVDGFEPGTQRSVFSTRDPSRVTDARTRYAASNWLQRGPDLPPRGFV